MEWIPLLTKSKSTFIDMRCVAFAYYYNIWLMHVHNTCIVVIKVTIVRLLIEVRFLMLFNAHTQMHVLGERNTLRFIFHIHIIIRFYCCLSSKKWLWIQIIVINLYTMLRKYMGTIEVSCLKIVSMHFSRSTSIIRRKMFSLNERN